MRFEPLKFVVPGFIAEGLTLFAGKPKIGKSWLLLHVAWAVAAGDYTLGGISCEEGDVLYASLEDNKRRLQNRLTKLFGVSSDWPTNLPLYGPAMLLIRLRFCCCFDGLLPHLQPYPRDAPAQVPSYIGAPPCSSRCR